MEIVSHTTLWLNRIVNDGSDACYDKDGTLFFLAKYFLNDGTS